MEVECPVVECEDGSKISPLTVSFDDGQGRIVSNILLLNIRAHLHKT